MREDWIDPRFRVGMKGRLVLAEWVVKNFPDVPLGDAVLLTADLIGKIRTLGEDLYGDD